MNQITVFRNINDTLQPHYISVDYALDRIKNGKSKELVEKIREIQNKSERDKLKMNLPCVCFSGAFPERRKSAITVHSGIICLDFDHVENIMLRKIELMNDKYIYALWISPSADGLKALIKIPASIEKHELYFEALRQRYPDIDEKCKDVSRVCYESYDPDLYINATSLVWDTIVERETYDYSTRKPQIPITDENEIINRVIKWLTNKGERFEVGSRNQWILKVAGACNRFGVNEYVTARHLSNFSDESFPVTEIEKTVKNAYKDTANHGLSYFEDVEAKRTIHKSIREGISSTEIAETIQKTSGIDQKKALEVIELERANINKKNELFWDVSFNAKGHVTSLVLNRERFIRFLQDSGFFRYRINYDYFIYIRITDNQVEDVSAIDIKTFVFDWVKKMVDEPFDGIDKHILFEHLAKGVKTYFCKELLDMLDFVDITLNKDTEKKAYLYYLNGVVEVTPGSIRMLQYSEITGKVWKRHIISRHVVLVDECEQNSYSKFLGLIVGTNEDLMSLCSVIGYLLHRYKDKKISKSPIFTDTQSNDNPEGGSGKGLIIEGIKHIRNVVVMNGKNFNSKKSFLFQRVEMDTEMIFIDDIQRGFNFEELFSIITEGITVEKKNKGEYFIPFEQSPKIAISTNYYVRGEGASNDRRKVDIEINNYFNAHYTPFDEFQHTLFTDWNNDQWNDFDNSMIYYLQFYLKNGIITMKNESLNRKKLQSNTSFEFLEFADSIVHNEEINRKELFDSFISFYPGFRKMTIKTFIRWISAYCDYHGLTFDKDHRRSHNDFFIFIHDRTSQS